MSADPRGQNTAERPTYYHEWNRSKAKGEAAAKVLDAAFSPEFLVVSGTDTHDRAQRIDRFLIQRRDGREIYRVDYKWDETAGRLGTLALEFVSWRPDGQWWYGWVFDSVADFVVCYIPHPLPGRRVQLADRAYVLSLDELRRTWPSIVEASRPRRPAGSVRGGRTWLTGNCCAPIRWLRESGLLIREVTVFGPQRDFWERPGGFASMRVRIAGS